MAKNDDNISVFKNDVDFKDDFKKILKTYLESRTSNNEENKDIFESYTAEDATTVLKLILNIDKIQVLTTGDTIKYFDVKKHSDGKFNISDIDIKPEQIVAIDIPESFTEIEAYGLCGCTNLESISISKNVTLIDTDAFRGCTSLKEINLPDSLIEDLDFMQTIKSSSFIDCKNLNSIEMSSTLYSSFQDQMNSKYKSSLDDIFYTIDKDGNVNGNKYFRNNIVFTDLSDKENIAQTKFLEYKEDPTFRKKVALLNSIESLSDDSFYKKFAKETTLYSNIEAQYERPDDYYDIRDLKGNDILKIKTKYDEFTFSLEESGFDKEVLIDILNKARINVSDILSVEFPEKYLTKDEQKIQKVLLEYNKENSESLIIESYELISKCKESNYLSFIKDTKIFENIEESYKEYEKEDATKIFVSKMSENEQFVYKMVEQIKEEQGLPDYKKIFPSDEINHREIKKVLNDNPTEEFKKYIDNEEIVQDLFNRVKANEIDGV